MTNVNTASLIVTSIDELPHLFVLPGCEEEVQILALAYALDAAYASYRMRQDLSSPLAITSVATLSAQKFLHVVVDGKRGTNDPRAYHALFADVFHRAYPVWRALLDASPSLSKHLETFVIDSAEYRRELHRAAMANLLALFTTPPTEPLVLQQWPF